MSTLTRVIKNPVGMARLVTNYSRIKEMQDNGLSIAKIADIFDEDKTELENFVSYSDAFVSGEKNLSLDVSTKSKEAFETIASALT